jgi:hypothetical protein
VKTTAKTKNIWYSAYDANNRTGYNEFLLKNYKNYPLINYPGEEKKYTDAQVRLFNVFTPGNIYLNAMLGDFDGDMMYMKSVFTKEANDEADRLAYAKTNVLGASGRYARGISLIGREATITLYELTKDG